MEKQSVKSKDKHVYVAPVPRWIENGHIFLWLIKDTCWVLVWRPGGIFMIFPTLSVAFYILWRSRRNRSEFFHNLAICLWICANSVWMVSEFLNVDKLYKKYSVVLFGMGIFMLLFYYIFYFRQDIKEEQEEERKLDPLI